MSQAQTLNKADAWTQEIAENLCESMSAEQLRKFAGHLDVSRTRGDTKMQTAVKVVRKEPLLSSMVSPNGRFMVQCNHCSSTECLMFRVDDSQIALKEAKSHKKQWNWHFPHVIDTVTEERLYG